MRNKSNKVIFSYIKRIPFISLFNKLSVNFWETLSLVCLILSFPVGGLMVVSIIPISGDFQFFLLFVYGIFWNFMFFNKGTKFLHDMTWYIKKMRRLENIYRIRKERKHYSEITEDLRELF